METLLALDISSQATGWSVWKGERLDGYGLITTRPAEEMGQRLTAFRKSLKAVIQEAKPDIVVVEDVYLGVSSVAYRVLSFFHGNTYQVVWEETGLVPVLYRVSSVRKLLGDQIGTVCKTKEQAFHVLTHTMEMTELPFARFNDIVDSFALAFGHRLTTSQSIIPLHYDSVSYPSHIKEKKSKDDKKPVSDPGSGRKRKSGRGKKGL